MLAFLIPNYTSGTLDSEQNVSCFSLVCEYNHLQWLYRLLFPFICVESKNYTSGT